MAAYAIFLRDETTDPRELEIYAAKAPAANEGHLLSPLVIYGTHEVLEGQATEGVVVLRFPSMDEARTWYHSPAYQEAAAHRHAGSSYRVILVEGVD